MQRVPALFSYLQGRVDESRQMGQFILSGSQNFHLLKSITQSLAGRVALFRLFPFDFTELKANGMLSDEYNEAMIKGFYPPIFDRNIDPVIFYANYIQTYIEKDVTELLNIRDAKKFRVFLESCAAHACEPLNISLIANECGVSQPTAKAWLSVLESRYIIYFLQPYYQNFNKRLVKSPKLYFYDTGLLCCLLGIGSAADINENRLKGNLFENMVIAEYQKQNQHLYLHQEYYFWQDSSGHEVDMLLKKPDGFDLYEIKATQTITTALFKEMDRFGEITAPETVWKTLVYGGHENQQRSKYTVKSWNNIGS